MYLTTVRAFVLSTMVNRCQITIWIIHIPRGPAEAVAFFVRQSGPLSRTADMPESSAGNTGKSSCLCGGHLGGLVCSAWKLSSR